jgi:hypothetical protein
LLNNQEEIEALVSSLTSQVVELLEKSA